MMMGPTVSVETKRNPGCLVQLLWFAFVGIWLGQIWMVIAWVLMITVLGLPIGIAMLNKLPRVIALREPEREVKVIRFEDGRVMMTEAQRPQLPFLLRAVYFLLVGWWLSAVWMEAAYLLCTTVIGIPLGFWMFDRVPAVLTLRR
jgi:uncharacterized membrane protein YccF (DUF307 family)